MKKNYKLICFMFAIVMVFSAVIISNFNTKGVSAEDDSNKPYYYRQLTTLESRGIYNTLEVMYTSNSLATGTATVDLVESGVLENKEYAQDELMADFVAGRDAFRLDYPSVFYVDFDKISVRQTTNGKDYKITMGIGRETNYYAEGFTSKTEVDNAVSLFNATLQNIVEQVQNEEKLVDKVTAAYNAVIEQVTYTLEKDTTPQYAQYVRNNYGALVVGKSVCEGYARALKAILDEIGVENVLVNGMFIDDKGTQDTSDDTPQPHMWNYVRMDDYRWYLVDATMGDGVNDSSSFLIKTSVDEVYKYYQEDGVLSLTANAFEFCYPQISAVAYTVPTENNPFSVIQGDDFDKISYNGMGIAKTAEQGKYIVGTFDTDLKFWYYIELANNVLISQISGGIDYDTDDYFLNLGSFIVFGITTVAPQITNPVDFFEAKIAEGTQVTDLSNVLGEPLEQAIVSPYIVKYTPMTSRLEGGKTYDVAITYSETLKKANVAADIAVACSDTGITNLDWDNDKTIKFTFTTANTYHFSKSYVFYLNNLVGKNSGKTPNPAVFTVVNNPVFACPKIEGSFTTAYADTPALVADKNLFDGQFFDENQQPLDIFTSRLALVASYPSPEESQQMAESIGDNLQVGETVLKTSTFNLSLGLCDQQVKYVTGKRVKVLMPFPDGFDSKSQGVTFQAYHFDAQGNPEQIDCVVTDAGIVMFCDSFSPFAIAVIDKAAEKQSKKAVMTIVNGNGSVDKDLAISQGENVTISLTAKQGNVIESVTLNGVSVAVAENNTITLNYQQLQDNNILMVNFADQAVIQDELSNGFVCVENAPVSNLSIFIWIAIGLVMVVAIATTIFFLYKRNIIKSKK